MLECHSRQKFTAKVKEQMVMITEMWKLNERLGDRKQKLQG